MEQFKERPTSPAHTTMGYSFAVRWFRSSTTLGTSRKQHRSTHVRQWATRN
ncbi:hypothetical protein DPMN_044850 [Dreissena polymorpha]|uniref:Uncharacterized protein n=1 Tax=Dreissena polymorpha TaxID=45954 RepID=A0A9D4D4W9_DREPO|nr:hypothetical protein DPMN_044850 [Dreissena polymorpha]